MGEPIFVEGAGGGGGATATSTASGTGTASTGASTGQGGAGQGGGASCANGTKPTLPPCGAFTDDFSDPIAFAAAWSSSGASVATGELELFVDGVGSDGIAFTQAAFPTARDCQASVRNVSVPPDFVTVFGVYNSDKFAALELNTFNGTIRARLIDAGTETQLASIPYVAADALHSGFRFEAGNLAYAISADGSCWTDLHAITKPSWASSVLLSIALYREMGRPGGARFDDVNLP